MMNKKQGNPDDKNPKFKRIRFVKKFLRHMPRKSSIHRYPVLNKFAHAARKRSYLWSFRVSEVVPAFYIGWIITLTPLPYVVHIIVAFFAALMCRANVAILMFLPILSNVATFLFFWAVTYKIGAYAVRWLGTGTEMLPVITTFDKNAILQYGKFTVRIFATITLGAIIFGPLLGAVCSEIYRYYAKKYAPKHQGRES
ncbi:MAG: DUF2062 domain-containing protein [Puniceicoccales bacterium]|jgi:uncharacterized protein (DUF2062 family)|nr:DUF2062 domain-containing protein [Puniceicoccales bacterium]